MPLKGYSVWKELLLLFFLEGLPMNAQLMLDGMCEVPIFREMVAFAMSLQADWCFWGAIGMAGIILVGLVLVLRAKRGKYKSRVKLLLWDVAFAMLGVLDMILGAAWMVRL